MLPAHPQAAHLVSSSPLSSPATPPGVVASWWPLSSSIPPGGDATTSQQQQPRPIHLIRVPSYNPPAFDAEQSPPPAESAPALASAASALEATPTMSPALPPPPADAVLMTPPPQYDVIVGTPSVDGMADYFARLADYGFDPPDDSDSEEDMRASSRGRVNVPNPRTPGGRRGAACRSMDVQREVFNLSMETLNARWLAGARPPE